jgi:hypothetical protein
MKTRLLLLLIPILLVGVTVLPASPASAAVDWELWGGNFKNYYQVGWITLSNDANNLTVRYWTIGDWWVITETHVAVATSLGGIPQTKKGNPISGHFPYNMEHDPAVTEYTYTIPLPPGVSAGSTLYIATHAVVQRLDGGIVIQEETAWGDCKNFPGKNWAKYIIYTVE